MQIAGKILKAILRSKNGSLGKEYATDKVILEVSEAIDKIVQNLLRVENSGLMQ